MLHCDGWSRFRSRGCATENKSGRRPVRASLAVGPASISIGGVSTWLRVIVQVALSTRHPLRARPCWSGVARSNCRSQRQCCVRDRPSQRRSWPSAFLSCLPVSRGGRPRRTHTHQGTGGGRGANGREESRDRQSERTCLMGVAAGACGRGARERSGPGGALPRGWAWPSGCAGSKFVLLHECRPTQSGPQAQLDCEPGVCAHASVRATELRGASRPVSLAADLSVRTGLHVPSILAGRALHSPVTVPSTTTACAFALPVTPVPAPVFTSRKGSGTTVARPLLYGRQGRYDPVASGALCTGANSRRAGALVGAVVRLLPSRPSLFAAPPLWCAWSRTRTAGWREPGCTPPLRWRPRRDLPLFPAARPDDDL